MESLKIRLNQLIIISAFVFTGITAQACKDNVSTNKELLNYKTNNGEQISLQRVNMQHPVDFTTAAEQSVHAVVHIKSTTETPVINYYNAPFEDFFFFGRPRRPQNKQQTSTGSGVIISEDGYIVTNNHVINNATKIEVTLNNKKTYEATVIGTDPTTDLALLKIESMAKLPFLTYGNSDNVKVGEWVLAVGNPFNLTSTVTAGIVSAKGRNLNILNEDYAIESFIQTDAAVNPGNSGGALVNINGELIGINTAIATPTGAYSGYSFAVPVNIVRKVVADLLEFGQVQRAFIGVNIKDIDDEFAKSKGLKTIEGIYVVSTLENGAAEEAGIKAGDIIIKINDKSVKMLSELQEEIALYRPGDRINVTVLRGDKEVFLPVILKNAYGSTKRVEKQTIQVLNILGATFEPVKKEEQKRLGIQHGVKIVRLSTGKLRAAGIREGFIITHINSKQIQSTEDIVNTLNNQTGGVYIEGIYPNGIRAYYAFGM